MAYSTYTPTATKLSTVDLPDDTSLEDDGIGAIDTPMETLADGVKYVEEYNGEFAYGDIASTGSALASSSAASYGTDDYQILSGVWSAEAGENVSFQVMLHVYSSVAAAAGFRVAYAIDGGARVGVANAYAYFASLSASKQPITIVGAFTVPTGGATDLELWLQIISPGGTQTMTIEGPIGFTVRKGGSTA